jgi:hypothetical protein
LHRNRVLPSGVSNKATVVDTQSLRSRGDLSKESSVQSKVQYLLSGFGCQNLSASEFQEAPFN